MFSWDKNSYGVWGGFVSESITIPFPQMLLREDAHGISPTMDSKLIDYGFGIVALSLLIAAGYNYVDGASADQTDYQDQGPVPELYAEPSTTTTLRTVTTTLPTVTTLPKIAINEFSVTAIVLNSTRGHAKQSGDHNHVQGAHKGMVASGWRQDNCPSTRYYNHYGEWVSGGGVNGACVYDNLPEGKYYAYLPVTYTQQRQGYSAATGHAAGELEHMMMFGNGGQLIEVSDEMKDWYLYRQVYIRYWNGTWGTYYNSFGYPDPPQIAANLTR